MRLRTLAPLLLFAACGDNATADDVVDAAPPADARPFPVDQPTRLGPAIDHGANGIALDGDHVFWSASDPEAQSVGVIERHDLGSDANRTIAHTESIHQIAVLDGRVYWATGLPGGGIASVDEDGGTPAQVAVDGTADDVAVDPAHHAIYWVTEAQAMRADADGSHAAPIATWGGAPPSDVYVDTIGERLLWVTGTALWACPLAGGDAGKLADVPAGDVVRGGDHLFVTNHPGGALRQLDADGGHPIDVPFTEQQGRLAFDHDTLYFAAFHPVSSGDGSIERFHVGDAAPQSIVTVPGDAVDIALTDDVVFYTVLDGEAGLWAAPR
jgi:hypothetical protein